MAKIVPKLNLNNHYRDAENNSIVGATNMMISNDYFTLQTEVGTKINTKITDTISNDCPNGYKIIYAISCNKEIVFFVKADTKDDLYLFRYNENHNKCVKVIDNFEYSGGELIGTFTYNQDHLIISVGEHGDDINVPLRVINLGEFDKKWDNNDENYNQLYNNDLHPICPTVLIPTINSNVIKGISYKGWYYIFIRYKIDYNTYTQWFNTNECVYIDTFDYEKIINTKYVDLENKDKTDWEDLGRGLYKIITSDKSDISKTTFECEINNIDDKYKIYQLGFVCISKTYSKCFKTFDLNVNINKFVFNNSNVEEYSIEEMITSYYNYYNVKTLDNYNNRLYISNYKEFKNVNVESLKDINVTITEDVKYLEYYKKDNNTTTKNSNIKNINTDVNIENLDNIFYCYYTLNDEQRAYTINKKLIETYTEKFIDDDGNDATDDTEIITYNIYKSSFEEIKVSYLENDIKKYDRLKNILDINLSTNITIYTKDNKYINSLLANIYIKTIIESDTIENTNDVIKSYYNINNIDVDINDIDYIIINNINYTILLDSIYQDNFNNIEIDKDNEDDDEDDDSEEIFPEDTILEDNKIGNNTLDLKLNNIGILPNQYYNFYIHFINKYGEVSNGYQLNNFNINIEDKNTNGKSINNIITQNINNLLLLRIDDIFDNKLHKITLQIKLDKIPNNCIGYFISYEKLEKYCKYSAYLEDNKLHNDRFNYDETIDLNLNKIKCYNTISVGYDPAGLTSGSALNMISFNSINEDYIKSLTLNPADSFNNLLKTTNISIETQNDISNKKLVLLFNDNIDNLYNKQQKELIPCSNINYDINTPSIINTKNGFITIQHALKTKGNKFVYYDSANQVYHISTTNEGGNELTTRPYELINWVYYDDICHESIVINNKPFFQMFPVYVNEENPINSNYEPGSIVEVKNTIDLFKKNQVNSYESYPKILEYYNPDKHVKIEFLNTIRRSNVIGDESYYNAWRNFKTDNYININENKGNIIKITGIGTIMLIHTEHSLFQFSSDNSLKTDKDEKIQLANVDIWDIRYKEILTSKLGYGGLKEEHHAIVGEFGYMFYDADSNTLFRFDNGQLKRIDEKITYFMNLNYGRNVTFVDDKFNKRILIQFNGHTSFNHVLSYHYTLNDFISQHSYNFSQGYSTKNNIYLVNKDADKVVSFYNEFKDVDYFSNRCLFTGLNNASPFGNISILVNLSYEDIKYLEYIKYKLYKVHNPNPSDYNRINYSGQKLIIKSEFCHTKELDLKELVIDNSNYNKPFKNANWNNAEKEPYFRLGNWYFNYIFNDSEYHYDINNISRVYGNWFVITFKFTETTLIELDSIDYKLNKDITE